MIGKESVKYSLRNMKHRKARNFLTIFSILVGIATIFIFLSFGYGLYNYVEDFKTGSSANKLLIMGKGGALGMGSAFTFDENDVDAVKGTAGISSVIGAYVDVATIKKNSETKYVYIISYDPRNNMVFEMGDVEIIAGRDLQQNEGRRAVFGYNYMVDGRIFDKGLKVNDAIEINGEKVRVAGFVNEIGNPSDDSQIYITDDYFVDLYPDVTGYIELIAEVEDTGRIDIIVDRVENSLRKERNLEKGKEDFTVQSFNDLLESFSQALNIIIGFVFLIALISIIVSAVNTANTMITSVLERYKEIGVLKAIGARNREIFGIFLFESAFLGFVAGVLGVLLGAGISYGAGVILNYLGWGFLQPYLSYQLFVLLILFAVITGAISGAIPALKASRINTVDALRYE